MGKDRGSGRFNTISTTRNAFTSRSENINYSREERREARPFTK
jgi:hypothetical protein